MARNGRLNRRRPGSISKAVTADLDFVRKLYWVNGSTAAEADIFTSNATLSAVYDTANIVAGVGYNDNDGMAVQGALLSVVTDPKGFSAVAEFSFDESLSTNLYAFALTLANTPGLNAIWINGGTARSPTAGTQLADWIDPNYVANRTKGGELPQKGINRLAYTYAPKLLAGALNGGPARCVTTIVSDFAQSNALMISCMAPASKLRRLTFYRPCIDLDVISHLSRA